MTMNASAATNHLLGLSFNAPDFRCMVNTVKNYGETHK